MEIFTEQENKNKNNGMGLRMEYGAVGCKCLLFDFDRWRVPVSTLCVRRYALYCAVCVRELNAFHAVFASSVIGSSPLLTFDHLAAFRISFPAFLLDSRSVSFARSIVPSAADTRARASAE